MGSSIKSALRLLETFVLCAVLASALACSRRQADISATLDLKKAATYLDSREQWWSQWVGSSRDHGTFCISCHTALPYALARPALRAAVGDQDASADERALIDNVTKRVRLWKDSSPYYSEEGYDPKTPESRGTESVLNALILANYDAQRGHLSQDTRTAFDNMWALQRMAGDEKGSWSWLQFDHEPWEAKNSVYYGACLAALAISTAPDDYASSPEIQSKVGMLKNYLRRGEPFSVGDQSCFSPLGFDEDGRTSQCRRAGCDRRRGPKPTAVGWRLEAGGDYVELADLEHSLADQYMVPRGRFAVKRNE